MCTHTHTNTKSTHTHIYVNNVSVPHEVTKEPLTTDSLLKSHNTMSDEANILLSLWLEVAVGQSNIGYCHCSMFLIDACFRHRIWSVKEVWHGSLYSTERSTWNLIIKWKIIFAILLIIQSLRKILPCWRDIKNKKNWIWYYGSELR